MKRKFTSYFKVQKAVSALVRGRNLLANANTFRAKKLLNVGCGSNIYPEFINLDYYWQPGVHLCWDITRKEYPIEDKCLEGVYTEHCLEHIPFESCHRNLESFYRMLMPGGTLRIVVPDGELYLRLYVRKADGERVSMPFEDGYSTAMGRVNGVFRNHGHQFIYDYETLRDLLEGVGFSGVKKEAFRRGRDSRLLIDTEWRECESLYVEASKPD